MGGDSLPIGRSEAMDQVSKDVIFSTRELQFRSEVPWPVLGHCLGSRHSEMFREPQKTQKIASIFVGIFSEFKASVHSAENVNISK
jgi:hypothetical protein